MEKKYKHSNFILISLLIAIVLPILLFFMTSGNLGNNQINSFNFTSNNYSSYVYIVYSPTCPHCHNLLNFVEKIKNKYKVNIIATTNGKEINQILLENGFHWDFGVPLVFAKSKNKIIVIEGYPSESQEKDGYFMGKQFEESMCEQSKGEKVFDEKGNYIYCKLPNGFILGNEYSVKMLLEFCTENECEKI